MDFAKRLVVKDGDHVIVNEGSDTVSSEARGVNQAVVSHLRVKDDGSLVEMSYGEAARHYAPPDILRSLPGKNRDNTEYLDPSEGLGETPEWFGTVTNLLDYSHDSFVYELDSLGSGMFFARSLFDGRHGQEYIVSVQDCEVEGRVDLVSEAVIRYDSGSEQGVESIAEEMVDGTLMIERVEKDDGDVDMDIRFKCVSEASWVPAVRELLTGVAVKHKVVGEHLLFSVREDEGEGVVFVDVLNRDFVLEIPLEKNGFDVPSWVAWLLVLDGCPVRGVVDEVLDDDGE